MPQTISLYKLFLASPSDVKEERLIVENVINEFNNTYSSQLNARIELCSWEKSSYPSVGEYPQAVINFQIGDEYDIFLGILWTRFGSKTLNYESGTEEEFYRALERYRQIGRIHIMMYFDIEGVPLDSLDIEQYSKVRSFQKQISELGCYYFTYVGSENFKKDLRIHLHKVIENWNINNPSTTQVNLSDFPIAIDPLEDEVSELGLLEFQDILKTKSEEAIKALNEISTSTIWIGKQLAESAQKLNIINEQKPVNQIVLARAVINTSAKEMNQYAMKIEQPILNWIASFEEVVEAFKGLLQVSDDIIPKESWRDNKEALRLLLDNVDLSYEQLVEFYKSVKGLPKITQYIILAKKNVCSKLKELLASMDRCKISANEIIDLTNKKLFAIE